MNRVRIALFPFLILLAACGSQNTLINKTCATKYPILLVHGIAFRDDVPFIKYWSKIPKKLEQQGSKVYLAHQNAFASHIDNALQIRERIIEILDETGAEKVNIIAHSKGGIEARYLISRLGMADKVASLTTLATPHRGSAMADTIFAFLDRCNLTDRVIRIANRYARIIGDKNPDVLLAGKELTNEYMPYYNQSVPNISTVYYQSYGGVLSSNYPAWHVRIQYKLMQTAEGDNDCIVSKNSYKWGDFKGIVKPNDDFGVSHFDIVGMRFVSQASNFDANYFMIGIVSELKSMGF